MANGGPTIPRELFLEHLRRQMDLALQLSSQMQARAQVIAGANTIALATVGALSANNARAFEALDRHGFKEHAVWIGALLLGSLVLSLFAALPWKATFTSEQWMKEALLDTQALVPLSADEVRRLAGPVLQLIDGVEVDQLDAVRRAGSVRGRLLTASMISLVVAAAIGGWIGWGVLG